MPLNPNTGPSTDPNYRHPMSAFRIGLVIVGMVLYLIVRAIVATGTGAAPDAPARPADLAGPAR